MPRITVAAGALLLIVFSIGFNVWRYPVVWEMVGGLPQTLRSSQPLQPLPTPAPESPSLPEAAAESTGFHESAGFQESAASESSGGSRPHYGRSWETEYAERETSSGAEGEYGYRGHPSELAEPVTEPVTEAAMEHVADSATPAMSRRPAADGIARSAFDRPLVRIVHAAAQDDSPGEPFRNPAVRRLPPVDRVRCQEVSLSTPPLPEGPSSQGPSSQGPSSQGPTSVYPSTGYE